MYSIITPIRCGKAGLAAFSILLFSTSGCVRTSTAFVPDRAAALLGSDTALLTAVIEAVQVPDHNGQDLRVDPRPIRTDTFLTNPTAESLADVPPAIVEARASAIVALGFQTTDALKDKECIFILPPPPTNVPAPPRLPVGCNRWNFTSYILALPRPGGASFPGNDFEARIHPAADGYMTTRVFQYFGSGYRVYEVVARPTPAGRWKVEEVRRVAGIVS